jgi:hypothetical protein
LEVPCSCAECPCPPPSSSSPQVPGKQERPVMSRRRGATFSGRAFDGDILLHLGPVPVGVLEPLAPVLLVGELYHFGRRVVHLQRGVEEVEAFLE